MSRLSINELKFAVTHPLIALSYLMRTRKIAQLTGHSTYEVKCVLKELELKEISKYVVRELGDYKRAILGPSSRPHKAEAYYVITRLTKPTIVVETGVQTGISSAFILQALEKNGDGVLYSIDLPDEEMLRMIPPEARHKLQSGWVIPSELKYRWKLIVGRSKDKLCPLLEKLGKLDIFLHDSEHTYENMIWEYKTAMNFLSPTGILLSDDTNLSNAFDDFCGNIKTRPIQVFYPVAGLGKKR